MMSNYSSKISVPWYRGIQGRLTVFALFLALAPVALVGSLAFFQARDSLRQQIGDSVQSVANAVGSQLQRFLFEQRGNVQLLAQSTILTAADVAPSEKATVLKTFQSVYQTYASLYITNTTGTIIAATDETAGDQSQRGWFKDAIARNEVVVSDMYYLTSAQRIAVTISARLIDPDGNLIGVVAGNIEGQDFSTVAASTRIGANGDVFFVNREGRIVVDPHIGSVFTDVSNLQAVQAALNGESGTSIETNADGQPALLSYVPLTGIQDWVAIGQLPLDELDAPVNALAERITLIAAIAAAVVVLLVLFITQRIVRPIRQLTVSANRLSAREFTAEIPVYSRDEIGQLADTFRSMAGQLNDLVGSLESRIEERTRDLQTVADVNAQISTLLQEGRLLQDVVDLTKERFRLYHAHIYLADPTGQNLVLTAGAGHVGRQMVSEVRTIAMNNPQSIVANAARARKGVIINDVSASATFLANPLLPDTAAELAVPLVARGQLLGVLDVQSDKVDYFTSDTLSVIELLAGQIGVAISNARLYENAERTSRHERALGNIDRKIQDAVDMDEILQVTVRELGKALRVPYTAIELRLNEANTQTDNQGVVS